MDSKKRLVPSIRFKEFTNDWEQEMLGKICEIYTGKIDANNMNERGKYNFYTSGKEVYKIDFWVFSDPSLAVAGNGVNMGYIHKTEGLFNAYQRTYVLTNIKINIDFIYFVLWKYFWPEIQKRKRSGSITYIVKNDLEDFILWKSPSNNENYLLSKVFLNINSIITLHHRELNL